jgi:preprotein translocase subunit SecG
MLLFTIALFDGRRTEVRLGRRAARSKNRPFNVSLLCLSTALCVARRSAVLARRLVLRFSEFAVALALALAALVEELEAAGVPGVIGGGVEEVVLVSGAGEWAGEVEEVLTVRETAISFGSFFIVLYVFRLISSV